MSRTHVLLGWKYCNSVPILPVQKMSWYYWIPVACAAVIFLVIYVSSTVSSSITTVAAQQMPTDTVTVTLAPPSSSSSPSLPTPSPLTTRQVMQDLIRVLRSWKGTASDVSNIVPADGTVAAPDHIIFDITPQVAFGNNTSYIVGYLTTSGTTEPSGFTVDTGSGDLVAVKSIVPILCPGETDNTAINTPCNISLSYGGGPVMCSIGEVPGGFEGVDGQLTGPLACLIINKQKPIQGASNFPSILGIMPGNTGENVNFGRQVGAHTTAIDFLANTMRFSTSIALTPTLPNPSSLDTKSVALDPRSMANCDIAPQKAVWTFSDGTTQTWTQAWSDAQGGVSSTGPGFEGGNGPAFLFMVDTGTTMPIVVDRFYNGNNTPQFVEGKSVVSLSLYCAKPSVAIATSKVVKQSLSDAAESPEVLTFTFRPDLFGSVFSFQAPTLQPGMAEGLVVVVLGINAIVTSFSGIEVVTDANYNPLALHTRARPYGYSYPSLD